MNLLITTLLFVVTAIAEIVGCYLPMLWLKGRAPLWVLAPAALSLALFVWLLTLHPIAAGRVYAAYGGVYVVTALAWLWMVQGDTFYYVGCLGRLHCHPWDDNHHVCSSWRSLNALSADVNDLTFR